MNIDFEEELFYKSRENVYSSIIDDLRKATGEIGVYIPAIDGVSYSVEYEIQMRVLSVYVAVIDMLKNNNLYE